MSTATLSQVRTKDGLNLQVRTWAPEGEPRAVVLVVHGVGEHAGRYQRYADTLTAAGALVLAPDHRGHGRSEGIRGHVDGFATYVSDLEAVLREGRPGGLAELPLFVLGHSLGGLITLLFAMDRGGRGIAGLVISNPAIRDRVEAPAWKRWLGRKLSGILPELRLGTGLDASLLSRDEAEVQAYKDDPLVHGLVSSRFYTSLLAAGEHVRGMASALTVPTLWILSGDDRICDAEAARSFAQSLPQQRTEVLWLPGSRHEPHNDHDRGQVFSTVARWLGQQIPTR